jgi:hypothetical protein
MTYNEPSLPPPSAVVRIPPLKAFRFDCECWKTDEYGRYPIGWCGPDCEGRPLHGRHARGEDRR